MALFVFANCIKLNSTGHMFYLSIGAVLLIYCSLIFPLPQFIKFIKCVGINKNPFFEAQHSKINILCISLFLFVLYILNPLSFILLICDFNIIDLRNPQIFVHNIANSLIFVSFFTRTFALSFDRYFVHILRNWIWRKEINHRESQTNLLLKYRHFLSSNHRLIIPLFCIMLISSIYIILLLLSYRLTFTIMLTILLLVTCYLIHKISLISDEYYVATELLLSTQTCGSLQAISHILYIILSCSGFETSAMFAQISLLSLASLCFVYFSCYWVRNKFTLETSTKMRKKQHDRLHFDEVMNHRAGIEAFCHHTVNAMCLEAILFIIEVSQFKAKMHEKHQKIHMHEKHHNYNLIKILNAAWMPIDERMNVHQPYKIALHLYNKYIKPTADFCINISSTNRTDIYYGFKHLAQLQLDSDNIVDITFLYTIFDAAYKETVQLMRSDTFARFQSTEQFRRLNRILRPEKHQIELELTESKFSLKIDDCSADKNCQLADTIAASSMSLSASHQITTDSMQIGEKTPDRPDDIMRHAPSYSLPSAALFNNLALPMTVNLDVQIQRHSMRNIANDVDHDRYVHVLNAIVVPADMLKTAGEFWQNCVAPSSASETLEIGLAIYLSMFANDRSIKRLFKQHTFSRGKIETLSLKFLTMIKWLIETLWERDTKKMSVKLANLGKLHRKLKLTANHFNTMLSVLHETLKFYFPVQYRLQEQYCFDYIFAYSAEIMMDAQLSPKTKCKTYFKTLEIKFYAEKQLNDSVKHNDNQRQLALRYDNNDSLPIIII